MILLYILTTFIYHLQEEGKVCQWTAEEGAQVLARFDTLAAAEEFQLHFCEVG